MCDYSLHGIRNRLAEEGETLVVHRFYTGSKGLASPRHLRPTEQPKQKSWMGVLRWIFPAHPPECAVCIPDGARLLLCGISRRLQKAYGLCATEAVTFRQTSADAATYRDAFEFKSGLKIQLQDLDEGQGVEVLSLASEEVRAQQEVDVAGAADGISPQRL